jgi:hypothetical protein
MGFCKRFCKMCIVAKLNKVLYCWTKINVGLWKSREFIWENKLYNSWVHLGSFITCQLALQMQWAVNS